MKAIIYLIVGILLSGLASAAVNVPASVISFCFSENASSVPADYDYLNLDGTAEFDGTIAVTSESGYLKAVSTSSDQFAYYNLSSISSGVYSFYYSIKTWTPTQNQGIFIADTLALSYSDVAHPYISTGQWNWYRDTDHKVGSVANNTWYNITVIINLSASDPKKYDAWLQNGTWSQLYDEADVRGTVDSIEAIRFWSSLGTYFVDDIRFFSGTVCPAATPDNIHDPTWTIPPTPTDGKHNNTNVTMEWDCNGNRTYFWMDTNTDPVSPMIINGTAETFTTNVSVAGTYYYKSGCWNDGLTSNSTVRSWVLDFNTPTITINNNQNIKLDNTSKITSYITDLQLNLTIEDDNLFHTLVNFTNSTGNMIFEYHNTSMSGSTADNIGDLIDLDNLSLGNYTVLVAGSDQHTKTEIKDYKNKKDLFNTWIEWETEEGITVRIEVLESWLDIKEAKTEKLKDKYKFKWEFNDKKQTVTFKVTSDYPLQSIDSDYHAHLVTLNGIDGNWIDFNSVGLDDSNYEVVKIDDYTYEVTIKNVDQKVFEFESIGGLNINTHSYQFEVTGIFDAWVTDKTSGSYISFNVTVNDANQSGTSTTAARTTNLSAGSYNIQLTSAGYENANYTITQDGNYLNQTFNLTAIGVVFNFYDEQSEALIESETFSVYLEATGFSQTYTTTDNPYTITNLATGTYRTKVSSGNYPTREYFDISITDVTGDVVNVYLMNSSGEEITFNVLDSSSEDIEDARLTFQRTINGTLLIVAEEETDFSGNCRLELDTNYEYTINISKTGYLTREVTLEPAASGSPYSIYMTSSTTTIPPLVETYRIENLATHDLSYTNSTLTVYFNWSDPSVTADDWCLRVWNYNFTYYQNCSSNSNGNMTYIISDLNQSLIAQSYVLKNQNTYLLKTIEINLMDGWQVLGTESTIMVWVMYLTLSFIGLFNPIAAILLGVFAIVGAYKMQMLPITFSSIIGLLFVAIVIMFGIRRSRSA